MVKKLYLLLFLLLLILLLSLLFLIPLVSAVIVVDSNFSSVPANISLLVNVSSNFSTEVVVNDTYIYIENYYAVHPIYNIDTYAVAVVKSDSLVNYTFNVNNSWFIINNLTSSLFSSENFSVSSIAIRVSESSVFYASYSVGVSSFNFSSMWVEVELPNGSFVNKSMTLHSSNVYKFTFDSSSFTSTKYGYYFFRTVFVNDSANLVNSSSAGLNVSVYTDNTELPSSGVGLSPLSVVGGNVSNPVIPGNVSVSDNRFVELYNHILFFEVPFTSAWLPGWLFDKSGSLISGIFIYRVVLISLLLVGFLFWRKSVAVKNERRKGFFTYLLGKR